MTSKIKLKSLIASTFKMHGFTLRSDASKYLVEVLQLISEAQQEDCLDKIIDVIQKQPLSSSLIQRSVCEVAVQECNAEQDEEGVDAFSVIDIFSIPRFTYVPERKKFLTSSSVGIPPPSLHGTAEDKARLFRERYTMLQQRTQRHDLFTPPAVGAQQDENTKKFQLRPVEYLLGSTAKLGELIVLGMLTQIKEGKWYIEDPTGAVQISITNAKFHSGLFTENCFVLAEGWYEDEVFHINAFGFPPPEPSKTSRAYFGNINFFGGTSTTCAKSSHKLKQIEEENQDAMFVFLSDVWLDQFKVLEKLRVLFTGYAEFPPTAFVLCGNFLSSPHGSQHVQTLKECFHRLADLIAEFPNLIENSRFIFVPGPQDPGPAMILPRPPISNSITEVLRQKVSSAIFASNPCRLQYCTQEIVIFREDIVTKMCRNCIKFPSDGDVPTHFSKTLICQGHLCPLPLHVCPIYWSYDNALRLYPLPDLIVCADKFDPFHSSSVDCTVLNPDYMADSQFTNPGTHRPPTIDSNMYHQRVHVPEMHQQVTNYYNYYYQNFHHHHHHHHHQDHDAITIQDLCTCQQRPVQETFLHQILMGKGYKNDCLYVNRPIKQEMYHDYTCCYSPVSYSSNYSPYHPQ